jgi:hypothetical protein
MSKTIHIFGYGETQLISKEKSGKLATSSLTKATAFVEEVFSKKPETSTATIEYHAINIFSDMFIDFIPKNGDVKSLKSNSFRVKFNEINNAVFDELVTELESLIPISETEKVSE